MEQNTIILASNDTTDAVVRVVKAEMAVAKRQGAYLAFIDENGVTLDNLNQYAAAIAALVTPVTAQKDKNGDRTRYGNALNTAKTGLKRNLDKADQDSKPAVLRVSLSGEGGGNTVIEPGHPLYEVLVGMIRGDQTEEAA